MSNNMQSMSDLRLKEGYKKSSKVLKDFERLLSADVGGFTKDELIRSREEMRNRMQKYLSEINLRGLDIK